MSRPPAGGRRGSAPRWPQPRLFSGPVGLVTSARIGPIAPLPADWQPFGRQFRLTAGPAAKEARVSLADDEAFEAFVRTNATMLIRLAGALTGDPHVSEEVVQSALERVFVRWRRLDDPLAYTRRVVVNLCRDRGRGAAGHERPGLPYIDAAAPDVIGLHDDRDQLVRAIRALPYRQRAVLVLRFWHDLTEQQAADTLGVRAGTVKSQTSRALQRLRQLLETPTAQSAGGHHGRP
jgi:RNA polymerase sigma-70 factor (sigma-E family)